MKIFGAILWATFCLTATVTGFAQPGSLDQTFGSGGKVIGGNVAYGRGFYDGEEYKLDVAVQSDGKIVVAANVGGRFAVFRFNADGAPDATFGTNGSATTDIYPGYGSAAQSVAIQPDGKILVGGETGKPGGSLVDQTDSAVVRFNPNGTLDTSFGNGNGKIAPNFGTFERVTQMILQPDGKILFTGSFLNRQGSQVYLGFFAAVRLLPNGGTDTAFGNNGIASTRINASCISFCSETTQSLALQPDGKIAVIANVTGTNGAGLGIARFLGNGQLDNSFDEDGKVFTVLAPIGGPAQITYNFESIALQRDGKIVVAGGGTPTGGTSDFAVFRYTPTGALDTTFDGDGQTLFPVESGGDRANTVLVQPNGKILVAGESAVGSNKNFAVVRLNPNGAFDTTFDGDGKATTDISGGAPDSISRAVLQPDGKILAVGYANINESGSTANLALARYLGDTPVARRPAFDFDGDGKADVSVFRPSNGFWYLLNSTSGFTGRQFGAGSDKLAPADYDGDGKTDIAVFRPAAFGYFYIFNSSTNTFSFAQFGTTGDAPTGGDWDGDGKADLAVYRAGASAQNASNFYYRPSATTGVDFVTVNWGAGGDRPTVGDYDGDGKTDAAIFRPANATWYVRRSSDNQSQSAQFGVSTDVPTAADFDGDGTTDYAVFRASSGTWFTSQNPASNYGAIVFGASGDLPAAADYDGDGKADAAVYRPSNGAWYLNRTTGGFTGVRFGMADDKPVPNAFVP